MINYEKDMKKLVSIVLALTVSIAASAQLKARWGIIDIRYPLDCKTQVGDYRVNNVAAWRGERVNLQLVVTNEYSEKDCSVEYRFSDLKQGRDLIPASNVVGQVYRLWQARGRCSWRGACARPHNRYEPHSS